MSDSVLGNLIMENKLQTIRYETKLERKLYQAINQPVGAISADATGRASSAAGECAIDGGRLSKIRFLPNEPKSAYLDPPG